MCAQKHLLKQGVYVCLSRQSFYNKTVIQHMLISFISLFNTIIAFIRISTVCYDRLHRNSNASKLVSL